MAGRPGARSTAPTLTAKGVSHYYRGRRALSSIDLELRPGSATGLVGRNGSGKTTLLRILAGGLNPTVGAVVMRKGARRGLVPDRDEVLPGEMSPHTYLGYLRKLGEGEQLPVDEALAMVDLSAVAGRSLNTLSRGYRQRVLIAQALMAKPEVLLLDEPFNSLDPAQIEEIAIVIRSLEWKPAVLFSSHVMSHLKGVVDAFVVLRDGQIVRSGPLEQFYGGDAAGVLSIAVLGTEKQVQQALRAPLTLTDVRHRAGLVEATVRGSSAGSSGQQVDDLAQLVIGELHRAGLRLVSIEARSARLLEML